jgi:hypothetical protein
MSQQRRAVIGMRAGWRIGFWRTSVGGAGNDPCANEEDKVAEEVTSQARFLGWLAIGLMAFALIVALVLGIAAMRPPV